MFELVEYDGGFELELWLAEGRPAEKEDFSEAGLVSTWELDAALDVAGGETAEATALPFSSTLMVTSRPSPSLALMTRDRAAFSRALRLTPRTSLYMMKTFLLVRPMPSAT